MFVWNLIFTCLLVVANANEDSEKLTYKLDTFLEDYDRRVRPNFGGSPTIVGVTGYVLSVREVNHKDMTMTYDMYFRQFWQDPRLTFTQDGNMEKIVINDPDYIKKIWQPDTFMVNEIDASVHDMMVPNIFLRILPSGDVLLTKRISLKVQCPMDLREFPFDDQLCYTEMESFSFTTNDIIFQWKDGNESIQISNDVGLPDIKVMGSRTKTIYASLSTGNYSRLVFEMLFRRTPGFYNSFVFLPSGLMVALAYLAVLTSDELPGVRLGTSVTALVSSVINMVWNTVDAPKLSYYFRALDTFTITSVFFCLLALIYLIFNEYMKERKILQTVLGRSFIIGYPLGYVIFLIIFSSSYGPGSLPVGLKTLY